MAAPPSVNSVDIKIEASEKQTLLAVIQFLKKHNLKETETLLKQEARVSDADIRTDDSGPSPSEVSHALAAYKSDDDPSWYGDLYTDLKGFVDSSLDVHKVELATILYPVFVHMYLELAYNRHEGHAKNFFMKFSLDQEDYYKDDLMKLSTVSKPEHMAGNQLMESFKSSKFVIRMSRDSYTHLKRHLQEHQLSRLLTIIQEHLFIDVFDGVPRNKQQIDKSSGGTLGESEREANKVKVYYGLLKEPELNIPMDDEEDITESEGDKPKKNKKKKDPSSMKKAKNDPNAPAATRIPLPELKDNDKVEKINAFREAMKRVKIDRDHFPSVCFYTLLNSSQGVTCIEIAEDSTLISVGFSDSLIKIWSLTPDKLRSIKSPHELELIDREADDVLERMMDERSATDIKTLCGHNGPIYSTSFSPDKQYLVSASADCSIRLWSIKTWSNLVCYKGHNYPVWDVKFSPHGHYFASCGHDRTARLWSTDHIQPLRILAGHLADVDCIQFHPNSNYLATGSSDKMVRLWDVLHGNCVRVMSGHKAAIHCVCFSPDGKTIASSGVDQTISLWDLASGMMMAQMKSHVDTVYCLCFSRDGSVLSSGGLDNRVCIWDIKKVYEELDSDSDANIPSTLHVIDLPSLLMATYYTKGTPVLALHFTRKNLLLGSGAFTVT